MQARVEVATGKVIAFGHGLAQPETPDHEIREVEPAEEAKMCQPGIKTLGEDSVITVTPAEPQP